MKHDADIQKAEAIDVRYVAHLARIELSDEEIEQFQGQLEDVLQFVEQLRGLDVEGVEPTAHAVPVHNVFRPDEPRECLDRERVMENAPQSRQGHFLVPRILE